MFFASLFVCLFFTLIRVLVHEAHADVNGRSVNEFYERRWEIYSKTKVLVIYNILTADKPRLENTELKMVEYSSRIVTTKVVDASRD